MTEKADIGDICGQVMERVGDNLGDLAITAGFRAARGRPGWFHCVHGKDRTPSAHVYKGSGRIVCFGCNGRWSAIDLRMLAAGCDYIEALKGLAAETGAPWPALTAAERERIEIRNNRHAENAQPAADWALGVLAWAEQRKADLVAAMEWALENEADQLADHIGEMITALRPALDLAESDPVIIARAYLLATHDCPAAVERFRRAGQSDRKHADRVTSAVVDLLAAAQELCS
jgi:hypothetical protein